MVPLQRQCEGFNDETVVVVHVVFQETAYIDIGGAFGVAIVPVEAPPPSMPWEREQVRLVMMTMTSDIFSCNKMHNNYYNENDEQVVLVT
jgi:hypothetical protein